MSITDELRRVAAKTECANGRCEKLYRGDLDQIADRIDAEHESACGEAYGNGVQSVALPDMTAYVKLPRDADGEPIHLGDTLYDLDGCKHTAVILHLYGEEDLTWTVSTWTVSVGGGSVYPRDLTHKRPDSLERIADEIEKADVDGCTDWADRIRKLAKEREHES